MLKDDEPIGAIAIYRKEVKPFDDKQIELVTNFAAQAVIAIENTRLLNELRQSLEQQTATSEILASISGSMSDAQPVFDAIVRSLPRLFGTRFASVHLLENGVVQKPTVGGEPGFERLAERFPRPLDGTTIVDRAMLTKQVVQFCPIVGNLDVPEASQAFARDFGFNSVLFAPMVREDRTIGAIGAAHREAKPFDLKEIALIKSFADQAVIAIENVRLLNELRESLQQQTATADVLKVISSSPGELEPVFQAMLENATRICEANFGVLNLHDDGKVRMAAMHNVPVAFAEFLQKRDDAYQPMAGSLLDQVIRTKQVGHTVDNSTEAVGRAATLGGARSSVCVPMLHDDDLIGTITIYRQEVRPFTDKQIELLTNFAAQAVIAIENTRLLNELRGSLDRQTAMSEVLSVISSSPGELKPVFEAMLANAMRICEAQCGFIYRMEAGVMRAMAEIGVPPALAEYRRNHPHTGGATTTVDVMRATKKPAHVHDGRESDAYRMGNPNAVAAVDLGGARTVLYVPMLKEDEIVGVINVYRQDVRPFADDQIALLENFAAQAVIAIENTRLLNELRHRTEDLSESLQQQTATSDILQVISNSPTDSQPAFDAIVQSGLKLFPNAAVTISLPVNERVEAAAIAGSDPLGVERLRSRYPLPLSREFITSTAILEQREIDIPDAENVPAALALGAQNFLASGYRAVTVMPMMRGEVAIGALNVSRRASGPLSDKQRALLRTFASQAVIAIENTRLFNELRKSLQQQTATADVLKVISRSAFALQTVLDTLVKSAAQLCEADMASINREKDTAYQQVASYGHSPELRAYMDSHPIPAGRSSVVGRTVTEGQIIHIPDVLADPDYKMTDAAKLGGIRTMLGVPLLREGTPIGVIALQRKSVRPFTEKQIELVTTFADQAVIAIENVRLFDEVQTRTAELTESLQQQTATAEVLRVISRSTFDLQTVLQTLVGAGAHLCEADQGTIARQQDTAFVRAASYGF